MRKLPSGRVAVVIGGSGTIGAAIARRLAEDGHTVAVTYHRGRRVAADLLGTGGAASALQLDVTRPAQITTVFDEVEKRYGHVDVVINSVGSMARSTVRDLTAQYLHDLFEVNVIGPMQVLREAARRITDWGRIINISSALVGRPTAEFSAYAAGKAALELFGTAIANELGARHVTVNSVRAGRVQSPADDAANDQTSAADDSPQPSRRAGQPQDIADVVAFLTGDDARWMTGQVLTVDGGATC